MVDDYEYHILCVFVKQYLLQNMFNFEIIFYEVLQVKIVKL